MIYYSIIFGFYILDYAIIYLIFFFSFGGSGLSEHLGFESQLLEVAIRTNDVVKVKQFLTIHREKFQVFKIV